MSGFTYKEIRIENGRRVLEMNVLPEKYCNFDCIFCPIGRSHNKGDSQVSFDAEEATLQELEQRIEETQADLVFINSMGEALVHDKIEEIIGRIKAKGVSVRLLSNGYMLGQERYRLIADRCDEVIGEIKVTTETDFQKVQRPVAGYTLEEHIANMAAFNRQYAGVFILEVTLLKGYGDSEEAVAFFKSAISRIAPDRVLMERMTDEPFVRKLGMDDERFGEISGELLSEAEHPGK